MNVSFSLYFLELLLLSWDTEIKLKVNLHAVASLCQGVGGQTDCLWSTTHCHIFLQFYLTKTTIKGVFEAVVLAINSIRHRTFIVWANIWHLKDKCRQHDKTRKGKDYISLRYHDLANLEKSTFWDETYCIISSKRQKKILKKSLKPTLQHGLLCVWSKLFVCVCVSRQLARP